MYVSTKSRQWARDDSPYRDFRLAFAYSSRPGMGPQRVEVQKIGHTLNVTLPGNPLNTRLAAARGWRDPLTFMHGGRSSWYVGGFPRDLFGVRVGHVVDAAAGASAHHDWFGPLDPLHAILDWLPAYWYTGPVRNYLCSVPAGCYTVPVRISRKRNTFLTGRGLGAFSPAPANIQTVLQNASASSGVPYSILQALAYQESSYDPSATSGKGAQGLLQLMPATAASLGVTNAYDAQQNANAGASYLASLYRQFGNWNDALVAYNEGPGAFQASGAYASSAAYASTILGNAGVLSAPAAAPVAADSSGGDSGSVDASSVADFLPAIDFSDPWTIAAAGLIVAGLVYLAVG